MADVSPLPFGLPNAEYLELYNALNEDITIKDFTIVNGGANRKILENATIAGKGYLVICNNLANKNLILSSVSGINVITLSGLSLTDNGQELILKDHGGNIIDSLTYKTSWYKSVKSIGGYSLEQIDVSY